MDNASKICDEPLSSSTGQLLGTSTQTQYGSGDDAFRIREVVCAAPRRCESRRKLDYLGANATGAMLHRLAVYLPIRIPVRVVDPESRSTKFGGFRLLEREGLIGRGRSARAQRPRVRDLELGKIKGNVVGSEVSDVTQLTNHDAIKIKMHADGRRARPRAPTKIDAHTSAARTPPARRVHTEAGGKINILSETTPLAPRWVVASRGRRARGPAPINRSGRPRPRGGGRRPRAVRRPLHPATPAARAARTLSYRILAALTLTERRGRSPTAELTSSYLYHTTGVSTTRCGAIALPHSCFKVVPTTVAVDAMTSASRADGLKCRRRQSSIWVKQPNPTRRRAPESGRNANTKQIIPNLKLIAKRMGGCADGGRVKKLERNDFGRHGSAPN
ncbi:hypothetical protein EVAR_22896_1 [Eumeta japonica]|uniref:Uncharacterized protein n=1 Tax=Eumeta variegata TaxID=151549 RepID=A0A4C1UVH2_EUMVA|nr:hypothetical protein EVAR_22896_1 [Eumeta japonica]